MTTLAHFAQAYDAIRRTADRALDLDEIKVETSIVEAETVEGGRAYVGVTMKGVVDRTGSRRAEVLCKRDGAPILHVHADLDTSEVLFVEGDQSVLDEVVHAFRTDTENGQETLAYLDQRSQADNPVRDLYESDRQKGSLLARCILAGLVEPHVTMTPHVAAAVGLAMVEALQVPVAFNQVARYERALSWATREDTQPEWALYTIASLLRFQQTATPAERAALDTVIQGELWETFNERFKGPLLQGMIHGGHGAH